MFTRMVLVNEKDILKNIVVMRGGNPAAEILVEKRFLFH